MHDRYVGVNAYVGEAPEELPWPACQACQFAGLWCGLLVALCLLVYEVPTPRNVSVQVPHLRDRDAT